MPGVIDIGWNTYNRGYGSWLKEGCEIYRLDNRSLKLLPHAGRRFVDHIDLSIILIML